MTNLYDNYPHQNLYTLIQSTANSKHDIYNWKVISSAQAAASVVWGPIVKNVTGGPFNIYVSIATSRCSAGALDFSLWKSYQNADWYLHSTYNHPNLNTAPAGGAPKQWSYYEQNCIAQYFRLAYTLRSRRSTALGYDKVPRMTVRAFAEVKNFK